MNIAIVDDEIEFLDMIENTIRAELNARNIADAHIDRFQSGEEFFAAWEPMKYHLLILDIYMDEENGIDVARKIREQDHQATLVFCTTSNEFASQSYEVNASYYLHKPLRQENVAAMLRRIDFSKMQKKQAIRLPDGYRCILYKIQYTNYSNHTITFYLEDEEPHSVYMSQSDLESILLRHNGFQVVNRGNIVNFNMVDKLEKSELYMKDGTMIPISRGRSKEVTKAYADFRFKQMEESM